MQCYSNYSKLPPSVTGQLWHIFTFVSCRFTFSGWVKVPALQGVLGSHSRTDLSQLPVTITLTSGQYSTHRIGASCVPTIVSVRGKIEKSTHFTWRKILFKRCRDLQEIIWYCMGSCQYVDNKPWSVFKSWVFSCASKPPLQECVGSCNIRGRLSACIKFYVLKRKQRTETKTCDLRKKHSQGLELCAGTSSA